MKEIPILYSTDMVQAKLAGRKTQTRRTRGLELINQEPDNWQLESLTFTEDRRTLATFFDPVMGEYQEIKCPYGFPGDLMWVRETFAIQPLYPDDYLYKASLSADGDALRKALRYAWKPSIHMPKLAARIWDHIVRIRVERLQEICHEDALAEGILYTMSGAGFCGHDYLSGTYNTMYRARHSFFSLWRKVNHIERYAELPNPWLWVIETETLSTTGRPAELERKEVAV